MSKFFENAFVGFLTGLVTGFFSLVMWATDLDISAARIEAAMTVCKDANSTLVSTDWHEATCANQATIPFKVKP